MERFSLPPNFSRLHEIIFSSVASKPLVFRCKCFEAIHLVFGHNLLLNYSYYFSLNSSLLCTIFTLSLFAIFRQIFFIILLIDFKEIMFSVSSHHLVTFLLVFTNSSTAVNIIIIYFILNAGPLIYLICIYRNNSPFIFWYNICNNKNNWKKK